MSAMFLFVWFARYMCESFLRNGVAQGFTEATFWLSESKE